MVFKCTIPHRHRANLVLARTNPVVPRDCGGGGTNEGEELIERAKWECDRFDERTISADRGI